MFIVGAVSAGGKHFFFLHKLIEASKCFQVIGIAGYLIIFGAAVKGIYVTVGMAEFGIQPGNGALGKWITVFIKQIPEFAIFKPPGLHFCLFDSEDFIGIEEGFRQCVPFSGVISEIVILGKLD